MIKCDIKQHAAVIRKFFSTSNLTGKYRKEPRTTCSRPIKLLILVVVRLQTCNIPLDRLVMWSFFKDDLTIGHISVNK